jgi:Mlc titration factor MtfA (ptsG expression regulator)
VENLEDRRGRNLVFHEFAHQLDFGDREANGVPLVDGSSQYAQWRQVIDAEYRQLVAAAEERRPTLLDKYGTLNQAEFFAVATECFFERPRPMRDQHPTLYQLLADYYRQDPAAWRE